MKPGDRGKRRTRPASAGGHRPARSKIPGKGEAREVIPVFTWRPKPRPCGWLRNGARFPARRPSLTSDGAGLRPRAFSSSVSDLFEALAARMRSGDREKNGAVALGRRPARSSPQNSSLLPFLTFPLRPAADGTIPGDGLPQQTQPTAAPRGVGADAHRFDLSGNALGECVGISSGRGKNRPAFAIVGLSVLMIRLVALIHPIIFQR